MKQGYKRLLLLIMLVVTPATHASEVVGENLVFLKEDGHSYLLQRSMRTTQDAYDFHLDKRIDPEDLYYIDPNEFDWESSAPDVNTLKFKSGTFTVMYPGDYGNKVTVDDSGIYTLNTWDGKRREDGRFGSWNSPDNFNRFVQAWVFPEAFKILSYESNREGDWVERNNTLTFFANDVNDLIFTVRYQLLDADGDGVADTRDRCPGTPAGVVVDETGCKSDAVHDGVPDRKDRDADTPAEVSVDERDCEQDCDEDGVVNSKDNCPRTPAGTPIDDQGCALDADGDGVPDSADRCPKTPAGIQVDEQGCALDADGDGVPDSADHCLKTPAGTQVDEQGCALDTDGDGVPDSADRCPETPVGSQVDDQGCALDADGDGVPDSTDRCPETPAGSPIDDQGCVLDSDGDGVPDSADRCPETPAGSKVNVQGCALDTDGDGVPDSADRCPETPAGSKVNTRGCVLDADGDGVINSEDQCPGTPSGARVNDHGCELDADDDGVINISDLCPDTAAGVRVDVTGCDLAQPILLRGVNFHFDSDELTDDSREILDGVANMLLKHPDLKLEVAGHTDSNGEEVFNLDLSQRRAEAVRGYLVSKGIRSSNLKAHGYGEEQPVASNESAAGRADNRRVELIRPDNQ